MLSLAGFPPTAGFMGKFVLFKAAVSQGFYILVVIAVLNSLVSVFYYLRVVVKMFMTEPDGEPVAIPAVPVFLTVALAFAVAAVLLIGVYPQGWFNFAGLSILGAN
jgi:NADH-quinone oxidoreductase subunit N